MVNVVLFPGNIELNHTVGVSDVVYCNSWVRFPRQLVIIAFNIRKRAKNASIEKGVATTCYNPRFITFLWLRTQPPIFGLPGSCLQRQFPGSLSSLFSKGTPKSVYIAPFPLLTDYPGLYASR